LIYRNLKLSESKELGYIGMNDTIQKKAMFLIPPLPFVEEPQDKDEKPKATDLIEFNIETTSWQYLFSANLQAKGFKVLRRDCFQIGSPSGRPLRSSGNKTA
jgi:hypothetical protein